MKTNFILFSLLALSGSPLFCAQADHSLEKTLKTKAQSCTFKRTGDTVLVSFNGKQETLDLNNIYETFFEEDGIGVNISNDPENQTHIMAQVFTKDTRHTLTKKQGTELLRKNHPVLLLIRLLPEDELQKMRLDAQLRAMQIKKHTALKNSDDDFS